ncbi:FAD-dependent oxidoreductase [Mobilicoccus sp.]|uniref:FAD-dependent oxidoreductase n=1 Tax=Mobilicoccus sp. TaxID=2034349 RepID=UPI0028ABA183|nr:FAD-dependent oxidoreductase [Mobilicoccus sp.]
MRLDTHRQTRHTRGRRHRVVVVGNGMVAARFIDELHRHSPHAAEGFDVQVIGEEPHEPYNRLLLSEVIAGRATLDGLRLPQPPAWVGVTRGAEVVHIDPVARLVVDSREGQHAYDTLVLATGAEPRLPLPPSTARGLRSLRTLDDCRELLAATASTARVCVVGGGLLGIELACGLRARGAVVTVVHRATHLMERQLDEASAEVLALEMARLGIAVVTGAQVTTVHESAGAVSGLELDDGRVVPADVVVVSAGVIPRTALAGAAGLTVDHGILVGGDLRSPDDPHIAAIGDCAQEAGSWTGLLAPGWDQARRLAAQLSGRPTQSAPGVTDVIALKAVGLSAVTIGRLDPTHRVLRLHDPDAGRAITVATDGGRVTGAICVGAAPIATTLVTAFERGTPVPVDPAFLLLDGLPSTHAPAPHPASMPASATVCRCNDVSKQAILDAHAEGCRSVPEVAEATRATTGCGGCAATVCELLASMEESAPPRPPETPRAVAPVDGPSVSGAGRSHDVLKVP